MTSFRRRGRLALSELQPRSGDRFPQFKISATRGRRPSRALQQPPSLPRTGSIAPRSIFSLCLTSRPKLVVLEPVLPIADLRIQVSSKRPRCLSKFAMDFTNTKLSLSRPITSYAKVRALLGNLRRNRRPQFAAPRLSARQYLDIGCGLNVHPSFVNLDYSWHPGIDVVCDITRGIPFPNHRFDGIFSEHCLEHISLASVDSVMRECYRILRPGGVLRIALPDGELYLRQYLEYLNGAEVVLPCSSGDAFEGIYSPILSVNRIFRSHGHLFIYDADLLSKLLGRNGFHDIQKESFRSGRNPALLRDTESRRAESLYLEAAKPTGASKATTGEGDQRAA